MITAMNSETRRAVLDIADQVTDEPTAGFAALLTSMNQIYLQSRENLFSAADSNSDEYFILDGLIRLYVVSHQGDEITLDFASGPGILVPNIARSHQGISQVTAQALCNTLVVSFPSADLITHMLADHEVQKWGDRVLQGELMRRARREWFLAVLSARDRLAEFRLTYPNLETCVPHPMIASYLGITPVTLSRIRSQL